MPMAPGDARQFRLLYVCTGNICRSPFAEILTSHLLAGRLGPAAADQFVISSAGLRAVVGSGMHPHTRSRLAPWRLDGAATRFVARQLEEDMPTASDLVLAATAAHRSAVVQMSPRALPFTFSLLEFGRLVGGVDPASLPAAPVERAHALVAAARSRRGLVPAGRPGADDVPDPIGRSSRAHRAAAGLLSAAVEVIVDLVAPVQEHDG